LIHIVLIWLHGGYMENQANLKIAY